MILCAFMTAEAAPQKDVLRIGIVPFNSPAGLFRTHKPLRDHMEAKLKRPVALFSSNSHAEFLRDALAGQFDIVIVPPHFGGLCLQHGFAPLVRYQGELDLIFAVRSDRDYQTASALRGKKIAFPDRMAIFHIAGVKFLEDVGMRRDKDYIHMEFPNHLAAIMAVALGMADAAVTGYPALRQMPPDIRGKLKAVSWNKNLPQLMTLARKELGKDEILRIKKALELFPDTPGGRRFFQETQYVGYTRITEEDLRAIQPFVILTLNEIKKEEDAKTP